MATAAGRVFVIPVGDELREPYQRQALEPLVGSLGYDHSLSVSFAISSLKTPRMGMR